MSEERINTNVVPTTVTVDARVAYGLCSYVDGGGTGLPSGWKPTWIPTPGSTADYSECFQAQIPVVIPPANLVWIPLPLFALVIQGTHGKMDVMEDFDVVPQMSFPPIAGAAIAAGSQQGLQLLLAREGTSDGKTESLQQYLESIPAGSSLLVTGHSLGGNLASVAAPWIAANVPAFGPNQQPLQMLPPHMMAITFAAPTAGNAAFAQFLNANPASYQAHFNQNDVVSNVWAQSGPLQIANIDHLFPAPGPSPAPSPVQKLLNNKITEMNGAGVAYTQTNGTIFAFPPAEPPAEKRPFEEDKKWLWELGYQHNYAYCVTFLGADACKPPSSGS